MVQSFRDRNAGDVAAEIDIEDSRVWRVFRYCIQGGLDLVVRAVNLEPFFFQHRGKIEGDPHFVIECPEAQADPASRYDN